MPILGWQCWWCSSYTAITATDNTADIDTVNTTDTNIDNEVDNNDTNDTNTVYSDVANDGTDGAVYQYADSEVMGMNALQQLTRWCFRNVSICLNLDSLWQRPFPHQDVTTLQCLSVISSGNDGGWAWGGLMLYCKFGAMAWVEWATVGFSIFCDYRDKNIVRRNIIKLCTIF